MKNIFSAFFIAAAFVSCAEQYTIQGSSSLAILDGSKLYLKAFDGRTTKVLDSCDVVHGKFRFSGILDTTLMATLSMEGRDVLPIVVERGDIKVRIEDTQQTVSGSPLNDALYTFIDKHNQLGSEMEDLEHRYGQMVLDGIDEDDINRQLMSEASVIAQREDSLVTEFVTSNFDNVLGPFIFIQMSSSVPQVEHIWSKAPETFKQMSVVYDFYSRVTSTPSAAAPDNRAPSTPPPHDIDDATIQNILNGK